MARIAMVMVLGTLGMGALLGHAVQGAWDTALRPVAMAAAHAAPSK